MTVKPGDLLSHYRLVEKIGEGGMGLVYRALDLDLRRPVALKMLSGEKGAGGESRARLLREARAAAALNHPNICTIYEVHEAEDASFIAMELVEGETVRDLLARTGPLAIDHLLRIAVEVAEGLAEAHARRIVHRDLKPQNVMVTRQGRVKILDFGLAVPAPPGPAGDLSASAVRALSTGTDPGGRDEASGGGLRGTIAYMSPEQALGKEVDLRSDLFSFGTMLYEMATGRSPFVAEGAMATLARILEAEPEPPSRLNPDVPAGLERVVLRCLRKSPGERYGDARDLLRALGELRREAAIGDSGAGTAAAPAALSPITIAVFPFAVRGSGQVSYLREGMVDLMSTKLDGAGDLRSVDAHVVLGSLAGEPEGTLTPDRAQRLAERFGAGMFVLGNVLEAGGQLHLNAALYEACGSAQAVARGSARGDVAGIFDMVDSLTAQLLTGRCGGPETRFTRIAAVATGSFPALKAYLEGEAEMRAMRRVPAVEAYRRSVAADPGFALAWYRMSVAALWSGQEDLAIEAARQALGHRGRLSERDGRLLDAFQAVLQGANDEAERLYRSLLGAHPDDVEAWYQLGELLFHAGPLRGRPISGSREAWERVVVLDPSHVNALVHLGAIAASRGDPAALETLVQRILALSPEGDAALWVRAMRAFARNDAALQAEVVAELRRASDQVVSWAVRAVGAFLGDLEGAGGLASVLLEPVRSPDVRALGHVLRAHLELSRGRWTSAQAEIVAAAALDCDQTVVARGFLAAAPSLAAPAAYQEAARADLRRWAPPPPASADGPASRLMPHAGLYGHQRLYLLGLLSVRLGDQASALAHAAELESLAPPPDASALVRELAAGLRARVDWAQGRREEALATLQGARRDVRFDLTVPSPFHAQADERFTLAEWLEALGRPEEALPWFSSFERGSIYDLIYAAPSRLRRGAIHERLGEKEKAAGQYRRFAAAWRGCDPDLRPLLAGAEAGLARLGLEAR